MRLLLLIGGCLSLAFATLTRPAVASEVVRDRVPAVLVVLTPPGRALSASLSSVLDAVTSSLRWRTDLEVLSPEQAGVDISILVRCGARRRMTCWARTIRGSFSTGGERRPKLALIVVGQPAGEGKDRLNTLLLDLEEARRTYRSAPRADPDWRDGVEDRIFAATPQSPGTVVDVRRGNGLLAYFDRVVDQTLREPLLRKGRWWPSGRLEVIDTPAGLSLEIDGQDVARTKLGRTDIPFVQAGLREVIVRGPDAHQVVQVVEIPIGGRAEIAWQSPPEGAHPARIATRWGGLGVVAAGAVVAGLGLSRGGNVESTCLVRAGSADCPALGGVTFGFDPDQAPSTDPNEVNPAGVQIASLGLALMASGATWSAGSWLLGPDESPPWWVWLAGAAIGGATYAVAAAAQ